MLRFPEAQACMLVLAAGLAVSSSPLMAEDPDGEKLFAQCRSCHQVGPEARHQFGPVLNGIMDKAAGRAPGYEYSDAFQEASDNGLKWDDDSMHAFLLAPMQNITGTRMAFPGVPSEADRVALIDYLRQFDAEGQSLASATASAEPVLEKDRPRRPASEFSVPEHGEFHLGRIALPEEIAAWDIDVRPDGVGLPPGSGNAVAGAELYDAQCAACHGDFGEGMGRWPMLAGGQDTLLDERPEKTVGSYWPYLSTVFDYVRRAMPFGNARSLTDDDVYAITAYLLYLNDLVDEDFELNAENFTAVRLPNESNFVADNRQEEAYRMSDAEVCMSDCKPGVATVTMRARVLDVTPDE